MDPARSLISSSAVPFPAAGDGGGQRQVFLFGGGFVGGQSQTPVSNRDGFLKRASATY
jgi:hypothetical protein